MSQRLLLGTEVGSELGQRRESGLLEGQPLHMASSGPQRRDCLCPRMPGPRPVAGECCGPCGLWPGANEVRTPPSPRKAELGLGLLSERSTTCIIYGVREEDGQMCTPMAQATENLETAVILPVHLLQRQVWALYSTIGVGRVDAFASLGVEIEALGNRSCLSQERLPGRGGPELIAWV